MNGHLDKMEEECGVFGVYSKELKDLTNYIYRGLHSLQHRGQEGAGIATSNFKTIKTKKGKGLVRNVFMPGDIQSYPGYSAIGHVRYSTQGGGSHKNLQPLECYTMENAISIAHNGNITNSHELKKILQKEKCTLETTSDTEIILKLIARDLHLGVEVAIKNMAALVRGSYALILLFEDKLIGVRDPYGIRPLCLGKDRQGNYYLSSETCGFDSVGATLIREVEGGELIIIDRTSVTSFCYTSKTCSSPCSFEEIYFARGDSFVQGRSVYTSRVEAGRLLARQGNVEADIVIGIPESGIPAALGFSRESGIPYELGFIKNQYIGRSFIEPSQARRETVVEEKITPLRENIYGKRVVVVDDSIVRGTTSKKLISILRKAGAKEIHLRSASPPIRFPCFLGVDMDKKSELLAHNRSIGEMIERLEVDSLDFLSLRNLFLSHKEKQRCISCFTGMSPIKNTRT